MNVPLHFTLVFSVMLILFTILVLCSKNSVKESFSLSISSKVLEALPRLIEQVNNIQHDVRRLELDESRKNNDVPSEFRDEMIQIIRNRISEETSSMRDSINELQTTITNIKYTLDNSVVRYSNDQEEVSTYSNVQSQIRR
jgi:hypothetical protein